MIDYILKVASFSSFLVSKYLVALSNVALQVETQTLKGKGKGKIHPRTGHEGP